MKASVLSRTLFAVSVSAMLGLGLISSASAARPGTPHVADYSVLSASGTNTSYVTVTRSTSSTVASVTSTADSVARVWTLSHVNNTIVVTRNSQQQVAFSINSSGKYQALCGAHAYSIRDLMDGTATWNSTEKATLLALKSDALALMRIANDYEGGVLFSGSALYFGACATKLNLGLAQCQLLGAPVVITTTAGSGDPVYEAYAACRNRAEQTYYLCMGLDGQGREPEGYVTPHPDFERGCLNDYWTRLDDCANQ